MLQNTRIREVRRENDQQDDEDVLGLQARDNAQESGASKPKTMREIVRQLVSEALESAAHCGEQPLQWVRASMSPAGWQHYRHLREEAGHLTRRSW